MRTALAKECSWSLPEEQFRAELLNLSKEAEENVVEWAAVSKYLESDRSATACGLAARVYIHADVMSMLWLKDVGEGNPDEEMQRKEIARNKRVEVYGEGKKGRRILTSKVECTAMLHGPVQERIKGFLVSWEKHDRRRTYDFTSEDCEWHYLPGTCPRLSGLERWGSNK